MAYEFFLFSRENAILPISSSGNTFIFMFVKVNAVNCCFDFGSLLGNAKFGFLFGVGIDLMTKWVDLLKVKKKIQNELKLGKKSIFFHEKC